MLSQTIIVKSILICQFKPKASKIQLLLFHIQSGGPAIRTSMVSAFTILAFIFSDLCIRGTSQFNDEPLLNMYYMQSSTNCSPLWSVYDFHQSITTPIVFVQSLTSGNNLTRFDVNINRRGIPGCTLQEEYRSYLLLQYLKDMKVTLISLFY